MSIGGRIIVFGALCAGLAVAIGAFGAHALEGRVSVDMLANYDTGARYHFYHSLGMVAIGVVALLRGLRLAGGVGENPELAAADPVMGRLRWAAAAMLTGIVLFSGSLYTMALTGATWWGMVTPFGGLAFLGGWFLFAWAALET